MESEEKSQKIGQLTDLATEFVGLAEKAYDSGYDDCHAAMSAEVERKVAKARAEGFVEGVTKALEQRATRHTLWN